MAQSLNLSRNYKHFVRIWFVVVQWTNQITVTVQSFAIQLIEFGFGLDLDLDLDSQHPQLSFYLFYDIYFELHKILLNFFVCKLLHYEVLFVAQKCGPTL